MKAKILARKLLGFLNQKEDFETLIVLKKLDDIPSFLNNKNSSYSPPLKEIKPITPIMPSPSLSPKQESPCVKASIIPKLSIYNLLSDKVKKACPELRIKEDIHLKNGGIPDCDVVILTDPQIPEVYQSLAKAIDKQIALTETVSFNSNFMSDLLTKSYKLALVSPEAKNIPSFMEHVKVTGKKQAYIGSTPIIFLDDPTTLSTSLSHKQILWQSIKTLLS